MRKQIPLVQEFAGFTVAEDWTATSELAGLHKNGYITKNDSSLDANRKFTFVQRPNVFGQVLGGVSPTGSSPKLVALEADDSTSGNYFRIYSDGTLAGTSCFFGNSFTLLPITWSSATRYYHLIPLAGGSSSLYANNSWFMSTDTEGAVVSSVGGISEVTAADYTAWSSKTNPIAMDGFIFQANSVSCKIYHSDQNAPTSWTATSVLDANLVPGKIMSLQRVRNYILAFKTKSIEFFVNAGNPSPGSTLEAVPEMLQRFGCQGESLISRTADAIIWVGRDEAGNYGVFKMDTNSFQVKRISNKLVDSFINDTYGKTQLVDTHASSFPINSYITTGGVGIGTLPWEGHEFVVIPVNGFFTNVFSLVYHNELDLWYMWTTTYGGVEIAFPWKFFKLGTETYAYSSQLDRHARNVLDAQTSGDFSFDDDGNSRTGDGFVMKWVSNSMDFGTLRRKFQSYLELDYELASGVSNSGIIGMYYYDNDSNVSSAARTIFTSTNAFTRAIWRRVGSFRNRKYVIYHTGKERVRFNVVEAGINAADESTD